MDWKRSKARLSRRAGSRMTQINKLPPEREQVSSNSSKLFYPKICQCVGTCVCDKG